MTQSPDDKPRKLLIRLVTVLAGPLLSIVISLALRLDIGLSAVIVIFALFMALVVLIMNVRLEQARLDARTMYEAYVEDLKNSYPLEVVIGHDAVEAMFRRLIHSTEQELLATGLGVDLSAQGWKNEIDDYLEANLRLLKRGIIYKRLQTLTSAPLEWLRFLHRLQSDPKLGKTFDVRFVELEPEFSDHRIFKVMVADTRLAVLFVNTEVGARTEEFAIAIRNKDVVRILRSHVKTASWPKSRQYSPEELMEIINTLEVDRLNRLHSRVAEFVVSLADNQEPRLGVVATLEEFRTLCPEIPDDYLHERMRTELQGVWKKYRELLSDGDEAQAIEYLRSWVDRGSCSEVRENLGDPERTWHRVFEVPL